MFSKKIKKLCEDERISKTKLSEILGINYLVFIRNVKDNNPTSDIINAFATKRPDIDLNWLLKEEEILNLVNDHDRSEYVLSPEAKLKKAITLLNEVQTEIALK